MVPSGIVFIQLNYTMPRKKKKAPHSKRFSDIKSKIDQTKTYPIEEAIALAKETSTVKFDATVEFHAHLGIDPKKGDQQIRSTVDLPHGSGKKLKIAAVVPDDKVKEVKEAGAAIVGGTELIDEIDKTKKINFDIIVTTPDMMKDMAKVAKILGPKGLMPNPKTETVTPNPAKIVRELSKGKISFKNDDTSNLHVIIGKVSFPSEHLQQNLATFLEALKKLKPSSSKGIFLQSAFLTTSMGPSIKISV